MYMFKYILKRIGLMLMTFTIIFVTCFVLVKLLPIDYTAGFGEDTGKIMAQFEARGYLTKLEDGTYVQTPLPEQFARYLSRISIIKYSELNKVDLTNDKNIPILQHATEYGTQKLLYLGEADFGIGFRIPQYRGRDVWGVFIEKLPPTILINIYSSLFAVPLGILLGIFAALKKNKWQDHFISTAVMVFISVPSFVVGALLLYFICFKFDLLPLSMLSLADVTNLYKDSPLAKNEFLLNVVSFLNDNKAMLADSNIIGEDAKGIFLYTQDQFNWQFYFNKDMFLSMLPAVFAMSFGSIAGYARFTRAELTEVLTSEFMLLARTKGLTKSQATMRHALRNSMVPIFPSIVGEFISVLSGSLVIERIFAIPGVGGLYLTAINTQDYDFFLLLSGFYLLVGLAAGLVIDLSYGVIDPRIRMGAK